MPAPRSGTGTTRVEAAQGGETARASCLDSARAPHLNYAYCAAGSKKPLWAPPRDVPSEGQLDVRRSLEASFSRFLAGASDVYAYEAMIRELHEKRFAYDGSEAVIALRSTSRASGQVCPPTARVATCASSSSTHRANAQPPLFRPDALL